MTGEREHQALWRTCGNLFLARLPAIAPLDVGDERRLALQSALWLSSLGLPRTVSGNKIVQKVKGVKRENADRADTSLLV